MAQTNKDARVRLETPTGQALVEAYSQSGLKLDAAWERRLPTIYRLLMAGLSANEIARMIGGDYYKVVSDIEAISYLLDEIPNIERVRADIAEPEAADRQRLQGQWRNRRHDRRWGQRRAIIESRPYRHRHGRSRHRRGARSIFAGAAGR